jgi:hypothetical protein
VVELIRVKEHLTRVGWDWKNQKWNEY